MIQIPPKISNAHPKDLMDDNLILCESYGFKVEERQKTLPIMYWSSKMYYYTPSRARFIVSSAKCSTKPLSQLVSNTFNPIFDQI